MTDPSAPIVVEHSYDVPKSTVWKAITEREQMVNWFFDNLPEFRAEPGFETQFDTDSGRRVFRHLWKITEVIPGQIIVYDWRYEGISGTGKVTFEVFEEGEGSRLRVTNEGIESFPNEMPEFTRESCEDGWTYLLQTSLKQYLDG
ncbi:SRPBCC domain-containing protein [Stieleria sp. ICT_E10.1]|uniref:SRPBCC family protein n=1 Tax=Stieleria sedimenti TaxID=2976331 RepID=UPI0021804A28|nr:SRPBCC domain-containing protein [Stieleria sedimenti]MCS7470563.1 SRPBCC domain-containing protein [Stieleria sedimenti]